MHLRDIFFCAPLRDEFTTAKTVSGRASRLNCANTQHGGIPILLVRTIILLLCSMPLTFCGRIGGQTVAAAITSPAPGGTLIGASTTFTWTAGSGGVTGYYLHVGTASGAANLVNIGPLSGTSATVNLPTTGATIYVQLYTNISGGSLLSNSYTYTEFTQSAAAISSPTNGSTLTGASTTFTWTAGSGGVTGYYLWVGTSPGTANLVNIGPLSGTSATVNLPTAGATIYVRLYTNISGGIQLSNSYTYTEFPQSAAAITSPTNGSTLTGASTTFTWSAGSGGVTGYYLWVGTSSGSANLVNIGPLSGTSATVNLPTAGATIYVRLYTNISGGSQLSNSYTYTEFPQSAAAITSPTNGSTLTGASTTFTWSAGSGGVTGYYLWVGTSSGSANLVNIGPLSGTSATVNLPTSGATIYVQLYTNISGGSQLSNSYAYGEASGSPTLSGLSCASGSMTGAGIDNCTVTLNATAPSGGFAISLASNNSAVAVPASVTVAAGATTAGFTATVSTVSTVQTVTLTASAKSVAKTFALQLGAAVATLNVNATSIAFGNVNLSSPATQSLVLTSTGSAPVTVSGATVTGSGFTVSGSSFPISLPTNQTATLNVQFDPTVAGAVTGQLTITSNSSTGSSSVVSLTGTGAVAPHVVSLSWSPPASSPDPVAGYNVFRAPSGGSSYTQLNSAALTQTNYTDDNVTNGQTYDYIVESVDAAGIQSVPSNMAVVPVP